MQTGTQAVLNTGIDGNVDEDEMTRDNEARNLKGRNAYIHALHKEGRTPGGDESREWLRTHGYWDEDAPTKDASKPKCWKALEVISRNFPDFSWEIVTGVVTTRLARGKTGTRDARRLVFKNYPTINGRYASLADIVMMCVEKELAATRRVEPMRWQFDISGRYGQRLSVLSSMPSAVGRAFGELLIETRCAIPPEHVLLAVRSWLEMGLDRHEAGGSEMLTIVSCVCPDYAWKVEGGRKVYTFDSLGDGIGIVAQRVLDVIPAFHDVLKRFGIRHEFVVAGGDFEADSAACRTRVGLSFEDFVVRVSRSMTAFAVQTPPRVPLRTCLFASELPVGGRREWHNTLAEAQTALAVNPLAIGGNLGLKQSDLDTICHARRPLYERWEGRTMSDADVLAKLLAQAPEYMAMGAIVERRFRNPLILQGDALPMATAFQGLPRPNSKKLRRVVYLKRDAY